jgi:4-hydroxybenzoyl-CoA thioesterase
MREIAKVRSVFMPKPLPAVHQRRIGFWFTAAGSSAENVTGGPAQSARHDSLQSPHDILTEAAAVANLLNRRRFTVEWSHCDPAGIVFNSRFFEFFDWGTWLLFEAALGVRPPDLASAFGIAGLPLVDAGARFIAPARFGDVAELTSQVSEFRRSSFDVEHRLFVRGALAVEGKETRVWAARDTANPGQIKAQSIPADVIARFQQQ